MSTLEVNKITPQGTGTTVTLGDSGDTITIPSGVTFDASSGGLAGTLTTAAQPNITSVGTLTGFTSTGIDDNATSTALTIASDGRNTVDSTNEKPLVIHHSDGSTVNMGFQNNASNAHFLGFANSDLVLAPAGTERMRIDSNGKVSVGDTIPYSGGSVNGVQLYSGPPIACSRNSTAGRTQVQFDNPNGTVGSISTSGSSTAYNTSSDHRLKENVIDLADATTRVKQLQPKRFNFIADADTTVDGFLAHEVSSVVPEAITGTHNGVKVWGEDEELPEGVSVGDNKLDDEGNTIPEYQGIDQSKLVPLLTASLQEAIAKIETLESTVSDLTTRLEALENA